MTTSPRLDPRPGPHPLPPDTMLRRRRPGARRLLERRYRITVSGAEHVPTTGPAIIAANHVGWWDGPMMAVLTPRPVHALTKREMFAGPLGRFLARAGQIPLDRVGADPHALGTAVRVLEAGRCVGIFPEGARGDGEMRHGRGGAAYLAMVTGAPVVPLVFLGTRLPGGGGESRPPRGSRVHLAFGEPLRLPRSAWPRRQAEVAEHTETVRRALADLVARAVADAGIPLPGPLPHPPVDPAPIPPADTTAGPTSPGARP